MQAVTSRSFVQTPLAQPARSSARPSRCAVRVCASAEDTSRRAAIGAVLAGAAALLPLAAEAKNLKNPAQDSIKRGGSSTAASMSSFDMEGIKKRGLKASQRKELLEAVKAKAAAAGGQKTS